MLLYFNGDSFTEGAGLTDHLFFPDKYPGNFDTINEVMKAGWMIDRDKIIGDNMPLKIEIREANMTRAYPSHVNKITGAEVINGAVGGSSMMGIFFRTMYELEHLAEVDKTPSHIFIGLTYKERLTIPNISIAADARSLTHSMIPSFPHQNALKKYNKYGSATWSAFNDSQLLAFHLRDLISIKCYAESRFNITPIFLKTYSMFDIDNEIIKSTSSPLLTSLWKTLDIQYITTSKNLFDFKTKYVADGHLTEDAHEKFAEWIVSEYLN